MAVERSFAPLHGVHKLLTAHIKKFYPKKDILPIEVSGYTSQPSKKV